MPWENTGPSVSENCPMNERLNELSCYSYHYGGYKVKQIADDVIKELTE